MNRSRASSVAAGALLAFLVLLVFVTAFLDDSASKVEGSASSPAPEGRKALSILLRDVGFPVRAWNEPPASLPRDRTLLWLARAPVEIEKDDTRDPAHGDRTFPGVGAHALAHYRRFVEEGGTIVLGNDERARDFLERALCIDDSTRFDLEPGAREPSRVRLSTGELLEVDLARGAGFDESALGADGRAIVSIESEDGRDEAAAALLPLGAGNVVLLADDAFLANRAIGERDHALLAVRLAEEVSGGAPILFDEYALGLWRPRGTLDVALSPSLGLLTLHAFLLLFLFAWVHASPRAFPRDPPPLELSSPLLRTIATARLLERSRRPALVGALLRRGVADRIRRELSIRRAAPAEAAELAVSEAETAEIAARAGAPTRAIDDLLRARAVTHAADLEAVGRDLAQLELDLASRRATR